MKIILEPTARKEIANGIEYRVYVGHTDTGIKLEMLGLFRIADLEKRAEFARAVCVVAPTDPTPVHLLSERGLIRP